jgi:hypothetical protein
MAPGSGNNLARYFIHPYADHINEIKKTGFN